MRYGLRTILLTEHVDQSVDPELLFDGSLDGAILTTGSDLPNEMARRGIPFVMVNRTADGVQADRCLADDERGAALVARLFGELGHRRIGAIFGPGHISTGRDGERGFRRGLADQRIELADTRVRRGPFSIEFGATSIRELMSTRWPPTAVFCANDVVAIGALNASAELEIAVPSQLSIVGFDDIPLSSWPTINLTTVRVDIARIAEDAAHMLSTRIANPLMPARTSSDNAALVLRGTHAAPQLVSAAKRRNVTSRPNATAADSSSIRSRG